MVERVLEKIINRSLQVSLCDAVCCYLFEAWNLLSVKLREKRLDQMLVCQSHENGKLFIPNGKLYFIYDFVI